MGDLQGCVRVTMTGEAAVPELPVSSKLINHNPKKPLINQNDSLVY